MDPRSFIEALHRSHLDNGRMVYYAIKAGGGEIEPVMPATPFIFEYFLFNSIYQHDWKTTDVSDRLILHEARRLREWEQQKKLLDYLEDRCMENPNLLERAFAPFKHLFDLKGSWTKITPDQNLNEEDGQTYFSTLGEIQAMLGSGISTDKIPAFFKHLNVCREFVGKIRNNIFHGAKSLSQIWNESQSRRIEIYHLFIQSLNSLFFLTRDASKSVASDSVSRAVQLPAKTGKPFYISAITILELQVTGMMKPEDTELITWANEVLSLLRQQEKPEGAMFYPSAGKDIITPILIGLPFCTEFHFYDKGGASGWQKALRHLSKVLGNPRGFQVPDDAKRSYEIEFEFAGIKRRIFHVKADNQEFLNTSSRLIFFFHRGDNLGEGGSDQPWDSEWFARWKPMIPEGKHCAILTDAIPHGLAPELEELLGRPKKFTQSERQRPYYCGIIPHTD